jgi:ribonuclease P protein component
LSGADHIPGAARVSHSFPRSTRLLKHAAFERVYREGRRIFAADLTVFVRQREEEEAAAGPRIGFTVGRALGDAVTRNRIKRRMRAAVRLQMGILQGALDIVINPKKSALRADFPLLQKQLERAFAQVRRQNFLPAASASEGRGGARLRSRAGRTEASESNAQ